MAIEADDSRLGRMEGRAEEISKAIQDFGLGNGKSCWHYMGIGVAQIGLLTTLVIKIAG